MLRLKRLKKDPTVSIQIRDRNTFLDGPFRKALFISFIIHVVIFGLFKVKFIEVHEIKDLLCPVEVAIEEREDSLTTTQVASQEEKYLFPLSLPKVSLQNKLLEVQKKDKSLISFLLSDTINSYATNYDYMEIEDSLAPTFQKLEKQPLSFKTHYYPLKIVLSQAIEKYEIVEDGRHIFKEKKYDDKRALQLPIARYKIVYGVKISGESGKVVEWRHKTLLRDKIIQSYGDKLIKLITFAPFNKKNVKGTIEFSFECDGEELRNYIKGDFQ